jgi:hypothetical protein
MYLQQEICFDIKHCNSVLDQSGCLLILGSYRSQTVECCEGNLELNYDFIFRTLCSRALFQSLTLYKNSRH